MAPFEGGAVDRMFNALTTIIIGDDNRVCFWMDDWLLVGPIGHFAPLVFASVPVRRRKHSVRGHTHRVAMDERCVWSNVHGIHGSVHPYLECGGWHTAIAERR